MKRFQSIFKYSILLTAMLLLNLSELGADTKKYKIGDTGPGGGIIFWDNITVSPEGWQYLEVASEDQGLAEWGCYGKKINQANFVDFGQGKKNTAAILEECPNSKTAAKLASDYRGGGLTDWYLPNAQEMKRIFLSLNKYKKANLDPAYYWTSEQESPSSDPEFKAYIHYFPDNFTITANKYSQAKVRAIRAF